MIKIEDKAAKAAEIHNQFLKELGLPPISPNEMNKFLNTVVIAPITTSSENYPTRIVIKHDHKIGWIVLDQIRTIDKQRIIRDLGQLTKSEIIELKSVLKETYID